MSKITDLLELKEQTLSPENKIVVEKYIRNVIAKLYRFYGFEEHAAFQLLEGSAFLETLKTDPEYVVNHNTGYWVEELYKRSKKITIEKFKRGQLVHHLGHSSKPYKVVGYNAGGMVLAIPFDEEDHFSKRKLFMEIWLMAIDQGEEQ